MFRILNYTTKRIFEDRLLRKVIKMLEQNDIKLYAPPTDDPDPSSRQTGITSFIFPEWFVAQDEKPLFRNEKRYRVRPLVKLKQLSKGMYLNEEKKHKIVVPIRFVQACSRGHLSDIKWHKFVHDDFKGSCHGQLFLEEGGSGSDLTEIFVYCEQHNIRRPLSAATLPNKPVLGKCNGSCPWLGNEFKQDCDKNNKFLVRSASNTYFPQLLSVISIPEKDQELKEAVDKVYEDFLQYVESIDDLKRERRKSRVASALEGYSNEDIWEEIKQRKQEVPPVDKSIKQVEIETLLSQPESLDQHVPKGDFYARAFPQSRFSLAFNKIVDRVVLVHKLREVIAQVGFTRFESKMPDIDGELSLDVQMASLSQEADWVPAIENRGEGFFISFNKQLIDIWLANPEVKLRREKLYKAFKKWLTQKEITEEKYRFPDLSYYMVHSLSQLLIQSVSLECGYSVSAIKERIYSGEGGYGILLYTGSSGSEGTLGGLVEVGKNIEHHLTKALELGQLCSNDPVCTNHDPNLYQEERYLHGAACHGCLLIAETSCERRNDFLDRVSVATVSNERSEFFNQSFFDRSNFDQLREPVANTDNAWNEIKNIVDKRWIDLVSGLEVEKLAVPDDAHYEIQENNVNTGMKAILIWKSKSYNPIILIETGMTGIPLNYKCVNALENANPKDLARELKTLL